MIISNKQKYIDDIQKISSNKISSESKLYLLSISTINLLKFFLINLLQLYFFIKDINFIFLYNK